MVRLATSIVAATLLVIPALAATQQFERDVSESDLYTRSVVDDDVVVTREDIINIFGRDFVVDLEERSPFGLGMLFRVVKTGVKLGEKAHKAHDHVQHAQNNNNNNNNHHHHRRALEEEELSVREFDEEYDLAGRELVDDLEEREPFGFGLALKLIKGGVKAGKAAHKAHEAHEHVQNAHNSYQQHRHQHRREFDEANLLEREYYDELD